MNSCVAKCMVIVTVHVWYTCIWF